MRNLRNEIIEAQKQYKKIIKDWNIINNYIKENWDIIILNGSLLHGKEIKGIYFNYIEADDYAPDRLWIHDHNNDNSIELHQVKLLKKVNHIKIDDLPNLVNKVDLTWIRLLIDQLTLKVNEEDN